MNGTRYRRGFVEMCGMVLGVILVVLGSSVVWAGNLSLKGTIRFPSGESIIYGFASIAKEGTYKVVEVDELGRYAFEDLPPGTYTLVAFAGGIQTPAGAITRKNIEITSSALPVIVDVVLLTDPDAVRQQ